MPRKPSIESGNEFIIKGGYKVKVLEYNNGDDVIVRFDNGYEKRVSAGNLRTGKIKNPFYPSVYEIGFLGVGDYSLWVDGKVARVYYVWSSMLERCYDPRLRKKHPTYSDCSVFKDWHDFQVFADWYYKQPNSEQRGFDLDKDLLVLGNKFYGPDRCSFVPHEINSVLNNCRARRGQWPQGVDRYRNKFRASMSANGKRNTLGCYPTPEEAYSVYKKEKERYVRHLAEKYKDVLHQQVYYNLMNWELLDGE